MALQARAVRWLSVLHDQGELSCDGVGVVIHHDGVGGVEENEGVEGVEENNGDKTVEENNGTETVEENDSTETAEENGGTGDAGQNDGIEENDGTETAKQHDTVPHLTTHWTYSEWFQRIASHFESAFFIPETESQGAYYRDCYNKTHRDEDDALRPNYVQASLVR